VEYRGSRLYGFRSILILLFVYSTSSWAQTANPADPPTISSLVEQIKELQEHDQELEKRIRILEQNQKTDLSSDFAPRSPAEIPSPAPASAPSSAPEITGVGAPPTAPAAQTASVPAAPEMHNLHGIHWRGFGEVDYKVLNQRNSELGTYGFVPGSAGSFYTGDFSLFLSSTLNERTSFLSEIDFTEGDAQSFTVDVRRILLNYDVNDHLRFSFGRYQTNIGYYNWAFRSAAWLQTTADRPLVMEYATNGGLLPTQAVGVSVAGTIPSGKLGLHYTAEYGSADTVRPDINGDGLLNDENNGNHVNAGFFATPDWIPGLRIGGSMYHDQISDLVDSVATGQFVGTQGADGNVPSPSARWNQTIVNGHVVYVSNRLEWLNEGFLIRFAPIGVGETFHTPAFYSQLSRKFGPIRPFVRFQYVNASPRNVLYNDVGLRYGPSFGFRYDIDEFLAFKAQLDQTVRGGLPNLNGLHLQLSGTF